MYLYLTPYGANTELIELIYLNQTENHKEQFFENMQEYTVFIRIMVVFILAIFELVTAFCLLKGILLHSGIIGKQQARLNCRFKLIKIYLCHLFSDVEYPIPWNLIFVVSKILTCGRYPRHDFLKIETKMEYFEQVGNSSLRRKSRIRSVDNFSDSAIVDL